MSQFPELLHSRLRPSAPLEMTERAIEMEACVTPATGGRKRSARSSSLTLLIRDIRVIRGSDSFIRVHSWLMISRGEGLGLD